MLVSKDVWLAVTRGFASVYPVMGLCQFVIPWYGMGKTSTPSLLNLPGRWAWLTMEVPGFVSLLSMMAAMRTNVVEWQSWMLAGMFTIHYIYRAIFFPLIQPSMAPIHIVIWLSAVVFQVCNGVGLGGWLGGYGNTRFTGRWEQLRFGFGVCVFFAGLVGNYLHDEELRQLRRPAADAGPKGASDHEKDADQTADQRTSGQAATGQEKAGQAPSARAATGRYKLPEARLFRYVLYPHYLCEWIEWLGFCIAAGWTCTPAQAFLINEVAAMLPRAINGRKWYVQQFGAERVGRRWAVIPGVV